jgi:hypothetical protein
METKFGTPRFCTIMSATPPPPRLDPKNDPLDGVPSYARVRAALVLRSDSAEDVLEFVRDNADQVSGVQINLLGVEVSCLPSQSCDSPLVTWQGWPGNCLFGKIIFIGLQLHTLSAVECDDGGFGGASSEF